MRSIGDSIQKFELQVYYLIKIRTLIFINFFTFVLLTPIAYRMTLLMLNR